MLGNFNLRFGIVSAVSYAPLYLAQFLDEHHTSKKDQPPCTPDMNPCDIFLFLQIKNTLKGKRFEDVKMIKFNVIQQLSKTPQNRVQEVHLAASGTAPGKSVDKTKGISL
jgi:hypothetical protein